VNRSKAELREKAGFKDNSIGPQNHKQEHQNDNDITHIIRDNIWGKNCCDSHFFFVVVRQGRGTGRGEREREGGEGEGGGKLFLCLPSISPT